jgi:plasmid stabilization system protein ParE
MVKKIKINKTAAKKIQEIAQFLESEYSFHTAEKFVGNTYEAIEKIQKNPTRGRKTKASETVRFIPIDAHRILFYRYKATTLFVLDLFDTRQHPDKRPFA